MPQAAPIKKDRPVVKPSITFKPVDPFDMVELKKSIGFSFPHIGHLEIKKLYVHNEAARVRANWYSEDDNGVYIYKSMFIFVTLVDGKLIVEDRTTDGK